MRLSFFSMIVMLNLAFSCTGQESTGSQATAPEARANQVEVIDFHSTHRCKTCVKIERHTETLLKAAFPEEMASGKITFKTVNIDKPENAAMAERFQAGGTALYLNVVHDGQEKHVDLTDMAFMKAFDEQAFHASLKAEIEAQLKPL